MRPDLLSYVPLVSPDPPHAALELIPLVLDPLGGEVLEGWLATFDGGLRYPILDGVALLVPDPGSYVASRPAQWELGEIVSSDLRQWVQEQPRGQQFDKYDHAHIIEEYLWTHYGGPAEPPAPPLPHPWEAFYRPVAEALGSHPEGLVIDAGCNVGRLTFAAAETARFAIGFDYSWGSIRMARRLLRQGKLEHRRRLEGRLLEPVTYVAPPARNLEFIVADALHPPFAAGSAAAVAAMHLLDRVPDPTLALTALDRTLMPQERLVLTASFSWHVTYADESKWLGGTADKGESLPNLLALLEQMGYRDLTTGEVCLVIRETRRFYQLSCGALVSGKKGSLT